MICKRYSFSLLRCFTSTINSSQKYKIIPRNKNSWLLIFERSYAATGGQRGWNPYCFRYLAEPSNEVCWIKNLRHGLHHYWTKSLPRNAGSCQTATRTHLPLSGTYRPCCTFAVTVRRWSLQGVEDFQACSSLLSLQRNNPFHVVG